MKIIRAALGALCLMCLVLLFIAYVQSRSETKPRPVLGADATSEDSQPEISSTASLVPEELRYNAAADRFAHDRVRMVASSFNAAPGAIVCRHFDQVGALFHLYSHIWERKMIGDKLPDPDPKAYGCEVLAAGVPMEVYDPRGMPNVVATFDGVVIQGVTMSQMLAFEPDYASDARSKAVPFPDIHNSPDMQCTDSEPQCSDAEFADALNSMRKQWNLSPTWLRSLCASARTGPSLEKCLATETVKWLNGHPEEKAPWLDPDRAN